ncbi:hypothetical protein [Dictyobacter kobayashii]|uniref:3-keto-disaccharide hydrolase domain-containing protein n=1 Tax=Dictyobacter kobayashii TaxID=2014872 RepID=A0A402AKK0_9CHLR|nr:hypothetical protein [Dictyobacter kobayashii]GCE19642.1 hypothetical protein KDK_34420 [Dictyobacter kobayashii]
MSKIETQHTRLQAPISADTQEEKLTPTAPLKPIWPPPPRPRKRRSILKMLSSLLAIILCALLMLSAIGLLLFTTTTHYGTSIRHTATVEAQQTSSVQTTARVQAQGTAQYFQTAQTQIEATATAEGNQSAIATQTVTDATATATAGENLYQTWTAGKPFIDDAMTDNSGSSKWDSGGPDTNTGCIFADNAYHAREAQLTYLQPCIGQGTNVAELAYQANVTLLKGKQGQAGLLFRVDSTNNSYYFFHIGSDGSYALDLYDGTNGGNTLLQGSSDSINPGFNQVNQLMILADKTNLSILANGHYLGTASDSNLQTGKIGVGVIDNGTPVDATFTNVQVWKYEENRLP